MKDRKKINIGWIITGIFTLAIGILFLLIPVAADKGMVIFVKGVLPFFSIIVALFSFLMSGAESENLYAPEIQPTPIMCRFIQRAYENHRKENSERKPIEQELEPVGNIILNKQKYINGINSLISETGLTRSEFEQDYYSGELFRSHESMLNISREFVTYSDTNGNQFIINSRKITGVYPEIESIKNYQSFGLYLGTTQKFHIIIVTPDITYKFEIADYMDRPVIDAFRRISPYLHYDHEIYKYPYPAVSP